ncbi:MAG: microcystin degradation protein MlrC [Candidatus Azotimanducaceae bacterium]|jgi:microcystin degradation protein MlrC
MSKLINIAVGGFQHETNTFAPHKAPLSEFLKTDGWPGLTEGSALFEVMSGLNIPIAGFIEVAQQNQIELHPILWCSAEPSSYVTEQAFETIADKFCASLHAAQNLDGVYLDLHGAMVTEHFEDGEGELLRRVRAIVGSDMPVMVSLDLHANVTEEMVAHATAITMFRTYPHLDMAETGARAYQLMDAALKGEKLVGGMRKVPFLFPLTAQCTDLEPCRSIYQAVSQVEQNTTSRLYAEFACGFPPADILECGATILAYGSKQAEVDSILDDLLAQVTEAESLFDINLLTPDQAVQRAMKNTVNKPVVLADAQDNSGAGATSDTTGLLEALIRNHAQSAVLALMHDPEVARLAHQTGAGNEFQALLGAKSGLAGVLPINSRFKVDALADGNFQFTGDMYKGSPAELGPMALLRVVDDNSDVRVIVGSERMQCLDLAIFRHLGVEPTEQKILVVKSSVHFRADFDPIAAQTLVVAAPGVNPCELAKLSYKNLRSGIRLEPMGAEQ